MTKIKICGLSREADIEYANELLPDYIGFVFAKKSTRYVQPEVAGSLKANLNSQIRAVGVFVNEPIEHIYKLVESGTIDIVQLHGSEDNSYIYELRQRAKSPVIKAFSISSQEDIHIAEQSQADYILLDSGKGGTGKVFDWSIISNLNRPFFLAGGLSSDNVSAAVADYNPFAVDISSGVEMGGHKDYGKMKEFIETVRSD
ncbi:MAG: phosphoribosylanthranilate isomerase [Petrimonas sp.]|mgnify:CR=1 FL=1|jgi:phosphoribosylanthranilate isomerase|nr:phosphoribosylanthranilate isomerase [Petrimonas sp.]